MQRTTLIPILLILSSLIFAGTPLRLTDGSPLRVADPCVYSDGKIYYLTGSNEAEHGFDVYASTDLLTWDSLGVAFRMPADCPIQNMLWASEVAYHQGVYYLTFSGWNPNTQKLEICLATSATPQGPFMLKAAPWVTHNTRNVIDANLFWDVDGTPYIYLSENGHFLGYSGGELRMARLKRDMSGPDTPLVPVCPDRQGWELHMADPVNYCNEGAEVFRAGNQYFMLYSANETHNGYYGLGYMTAPTPLGPWSKADENPLMQSHHQTAPTDGSISSPGHCGVIPSKNPNKGHLIYHQHAPWVKSYPSNDRVTYLTTYTIKKSHLTIGL